MSTKKASVNTIDVIELIFIAGCILVATFFIRVEERTIFLKYMKMLFFSIVMAKISSNFKNEKISFLFLILTVFFMSFMYAFRDNSGIDDVIYRNFFYEARNFDFIGYMKNSHLEIGYTILNYLIYVISNGKYEVAQIIFSIFPVYLIEYTLWKKRKYINFSVSTLLVFMTLLYFVMSAALVRIFISVSIVIYAYRYIIENNPKKYIFSIILASTFHISSLFMLILLLLLVKKEYYYKNIKSFSFIILVFVPLLFVAICKFVVPLMSQRYSGYTLDNNEARSILSFIDRLPFLFIGLFFYKNICDEYSFLEREYKLNMVLILLSISVNIAGVWTSLGRCVYYTNCGIIMLMPMILTAKNKKEYNTDEVVSLLCIITLFFIYIMHTVFINPNVWNQLKSYSLFI